MLTLACCDWPHVFQPLALGLYILFSLSFIILFFVAVLSFQGSSVFSFLFEEPQQNSSASTKHSDIGAAEELIKNPFQSALRLPYDSSAESEEDGEDDMIADTTVSSEGQPFNSSKPFDEMFFFHPGDPQLVNRINGEFASFTIVFSLSKSFAAVFLRYPTTPAFP